MSKSKYAKYIIYDVPPPPPGQKPLGTPKRLAEERAKGNYMEATWMFTLDDKIARGGIYTNCVWLWAKHGKDLEIEIAHTHNFDETLGFIGTVRENPRELGGELDLWLEDEKFTINKSCLIFVPKGMKHLPLVLKRIDSPIFFWTAGNGTEYTRTSGNEEFV